MPATQHCAKFVHCLIYRQRILRHNGGSIHNGSDHPIIVNHPIIVHRRRHHLPVTCTNSVRSIRNSIYSKRRLFEVVVVVVVVVWWWIIIDVECQSSYHCIAVVSQCAIISHHHILSTISCTIHQMVYGVKVLALPR